MYNKFRPILGGHLRTFIIIIIIILVHIFTKDTSRECPDRQYVLAGKNFVQLVAQAFSVQSEPPLCKRKTLFALITL